MDYMTNPIQNDWKDALQEEFGKEYFIKLMEYVKKEYETGQVFPEQENIFNAFHLTPLHEVRAVIIGQDPYHNVGQAHGLCFSVKKGVAVPPSLVNIYKELKDDLGCEIPNHGYLENWAKQGVLMLNTVLTVRAHEPNSHKNMGWETFTDAVIQILNKHNKPIVFLLWGAPAQKKEKMLTNSKHFIFKSPHPSPLSSYRGFFGSKPFSKTNELLIEQKEIPIDWCVID